MLIRRESVSPPNTILLIALMRSGFHFYLLYHWEIILLATLFSTRINSRQKKIQNLALTNLKLNCNPALLLVLFCSRIDSQREICFYILNCHPFSLRELIPVPYSSLLWIPNYFILYSSIYTYFYENWFVKEVIVFKR